MLICLLAFQHVGKQDLVEAFCEVAGREFGFAVAAYRAKALNDVAVIKPESV